MTIAPSEWLLAIDNSRLGPSQLGVAERSGPAVVAAFVACQYAVLLAADGVAVLDMMTQQTVLTTVYPYVLRAKLDALAPLVPVGHPWLPDQQGSGQRRCARCGQAIETCLVKTKPPHTHVVLRDHKVKGVACPGSRCTVAT